MHRVAIFITLLSGGCITPDPEQKSAEKLLHGMTNEWNAVPSENSVNVLSLLELVDEDKARSLIHRALEQNLNLKQTALLLTESGQRLGIYDANRKPTLDWTGSASRNDDSEEEVRTTLGSMLQLSWELDVWGRLADKRKAAHSEHIAVQFDYQAARQSLAGRTLELVLETAYRRQAVDLQSRQVRSSKDNLEVIRHRFQRGLRNLTDIDAAEAEYASAEAVRLLRAEELMVTRLALSEIIGGRQVASAELLSTFPKVLNPTPPVPAEVLSHRPDVAAALARYNARRKRSTATDKTRLPGFTFSADFSLESSSLSKLLHEDPIWAILGGVTAPILDGKRRKFQSTAGRTAAERALVAYQETMFKAVLEVERLLERELSLHAQAVELELAVKHAQRSREVFEKQYARGLVNILDLLSAQRTFFTAELNLLDARFRQLSNRVNLGLALGLETM